MQKQSQRRADGASAILEALEALGAGDFSVRLPEGGTGTDGEVNRAFNQVADLNERTSRALRRTSRIVGRHGQMAVRASMPGAVGGWARNVDALNELIDDLTQPAIQVSHVLGAVAEGDLTQRMAVDFNGRPLRGEFRLRRERDHQLRTDDERPMRTMRQDDGEPTPEATHQWPRPPRHPPGRRDGPTRPVARGGPPAAHR